MEDRKKVAISQQEIDRQMDFIDQIRSLLLVADSKTRYFFVHSFGCQQNAADAEKIKGMLFKMGYLPTENIKQADVIFYNTCAVRENAEDRVLGAIGELKRQKKENPELVIALCGCMTEQSRVADKIRTSYPHVNLVCGTNSLHKIPELLFEVLSHRKRIFDLPPQEKTIAEGLPILRDDRYKAWLPIMYGCDNFCSYCIVPYVRGRERSRDSESVLAEARQLVAEGYKEITLLGQNVNSYGKGLEESITFAQLLEKINAIPGDFRIRFMTSHPKDATKELIDTMARCEKVCRHLHLPVQCGSDRVLQQMNRHYTVEQYLDLIDYARKQIPDISFSSDIIVGFPGESYEEFRQTVDLVRQVGYDLLYTFVYSPRSGTKAAELPDPISEKQKGLWLRELIEVQEEISQERNQVLIGKTLRVLPDAISRRAGYLSGRSSQNLIVEFEGDPALIGRFVDVTITTAHNWSVEGRLVK